ncbi:MAG: hypothetical protein ACOX17_02905 [Christensenellales bacterium]
MARINPTKKVVLFLLEGSTDQYALGYTLSRLLSSRRIHFALTQGDICCRNGITPDTACRVLQSVIQRFLRESKFRRSDMLCVIHILDTDGAFIPPERVVYNRKVKTVYYIDRIETAFTDSTRLRNHAKREAADRLSGMDQINGIPYTLRFFSRNREHVLHNKAGNISGKEKRRLAAEFDARYGDHPLAFLDFLLSPEVAVPCGDESSWPFIMEGVHSLERYTNLGPPLVRLRETDGRSFAARESSKDTPGSLQDSAK